MPILLSSRYEVGAIIGVGGSAKVHEGRDVLLDRRVAIKLLDATLVDSADPSGHDRFLREARSSARFSHPNAVSVYDAGEDGGQLFLVMELVEGGTLAQHIADDAPLDDEEVVRIGSQILSALGAAHAVGLVHRDVKPANVLLDHDGNVKLADFGIAKRFDQLSDNLTGVGLVVGTRSYLAPEQAIGDGAAPATDLYAVGVVLYEMATGIRPTPTGAGAAPSADARRGPPDISPAIAYTAMRAMATDPAARFESATDMASALSGHARDITSNAPMSTFRPSPVAPLPSGPNDTAVMSTPYAKTEAMAPIVRTATIVEPAVRQGGGQRTRAWRIAATLLLVVLVAGIAIGLNRRNGADDDLLGRTTLDATQPPTAQPTALATTVPPTTALPVAATVAPSAGPTPTALVIPNDLGEFIQLLRENPDVVGGSGDRLADQLENQFDDADRKGRSDRQKLSRDIAKWVDDGTLDPTVAAAALEFLDD